MTDDKRVQWRDHAINQFSVAISLFIALSGATLGFGLTLLRNESFMCSLCLWQVYVFLGGLISLFLSVVLGLSAVFTRLRRVWYTFRQYGEDQQVCFQDEITPLGKWTHGLLWCGGVLFALGIVALMISLYYGYVAKLIEIKTLNKTTGAMKSGLSISWLGRTFRRHQFKE